MANYCLKGTMSVCGAIIDDSLEQDTCEFYSKAPFEFRRCVHNPFSEFCTCLKAQQQRDAGEKNEA